MLITQKFYGEPSTTSPILSEMWTHDFKNEGEK